jgi:hypothetical protein
MARAGFKQEYRVALALLDGFSRILLDAATL